MCNLIVNDENKGDHTGFQSGSKMYIFIFLEHPNSCYLLLSKYKPLNECYTFLDYL